MTPRPLILLLALVGGCSASRPPSVEVPPTLATDAPLNRAQARTEGVAALGNAAKPQSNDTGKALLNAQSDQIDGLKADLAAALAANEAATKEWAVRAGEYTASLGRTEATATLWRDRHDALYDSWGAWTERWVRRLIVVYVVFCVAWAGLSVLGLAIPGGFGFALTAASRLLAPAIPFSAWFTTAADNLWFRRLAKQAPTP